MTSHTELAPMRETKFNLANFARKNALQIGIVTVFLAIWIVFIVGASDTFLSPEIYAAFMATVPVFGIIALPLTMVTIAGEMDLSFPSIMAIGRSLFWGYTMPPTASGLDLSPAC